MKKRVFTLLLSVFAVLSASQADPLTAVWAEQYLKSHHAALLEGSERDHVMSLYYFGQHGSRSLMGLERVRGDDYEQHFSLLIFEGKVLIGYYQDVLSFPSLINEKGEVSFPLGVRSAYQQSGQPLSLAGASQRNDALCQKQEEISACFVYHKLK